MAGQDKRGGVEVTLLLSGFPGVSYFRGAVSKAFTLESVCLSFPNVSGSLFQL